MNVNLTNLRGMTLQVNVTGRLRFRMWLGLLLMRVAARVMGCGVQIDHDRNDDAWMP